MKRFATWGEQGNAAQREQWRAALIEAHGNITQAGRSLGFGKNRAMVLTRIHGLNEYAQQLRITFNGKAKGRPRED